MIFQTVQFLPISLERAWDFFTDPANLEKLTPGDMMFRITSDFNSKKIYPGMIITYLVSPLFRIPIQWITEITHVKYNEYFIDNQISGPFKIWHHQHHFRIVEGGVEMTDIVHYIVGFGFLGRIANTLVVKKRVRRIFEYRRRILSESFTREGNL